MQRWVQQADGHRALLQQGEHFLEILALHFQQLCQVLFAFVQCAGKNHLADGRYPILMEEHVLGPAKSDTFRAQGQGLSDVGRGIRIGFDLQHFHFVDPVHEGAEFAAQSRVLLGDFAGVDSAGCAIDRKQVALVQGDVIDDNCFVFFIDDGCGTAGHTAFSQTAGDDCRVRSHAAACRQDAFRTHHTGQILRRCFAADQDDWQAVLFCCFGSGCGEVDMSGCRSR